MKTLALVPFALLPFVVRAADAPAWRLQPSFSFPKWENMQPSLSLSGEVKSGPVTVTSPAGSPFHAPTPNVASPKPVSRMPIVKPSSDIDPKMVKAPDATTDFKLIVKPPAVEPAK